MTRNGRLIFYVKPLQDTKEAFSRTKVQLEQLGYLPFLRPKDKRLMLLIMPKPSVKPSRLIWNIVLFIATIGTTLYAGYNISTPMVEQGFMDNAWTGAITFSAAIIGVLGCHEMGHKLMANKRGVDATLPYFIPAPIFIGTLGALIRMKTPTLNRDALFDVGVAGPLAGFAALIPITILGIYWSHPVSAQALPPGTIYLPVPYLFDLLYQLTGPLTPAGFTLLFHPVALAGWVGMLVTMLNLMPVGMLDGGHIARTLFGWRWHRVVSIVAAMATFALGWWFMAIFMLFFALTPHPGPLEDVSELAFNRKLISIAVFAILFLCAVPGWELSFGQTG